MNLKAIASVTAKNAVNAIITNATLLTLLGNWQQIGTHDGIMMILKTTVSVVFAREAIVWFPKILAWSQSVEAQTIPPKA
jgi:hypothetical protein